MDGRTDSGIEIRRILLLTELRQTARGLTMGQLVKNCGKVEGWSLSRTGLWEGVRHVLQSLINDGLVGVKSRFIITSKGEDYLADPLKWRLKVETNEEIERKLFWNTIYDVFDKALARLLARLQETKSS